MSTSAGGFPPESCPYPQRWAVRGPIRARRGRRRRTATRSVGVDQLPDRGDLAAQLVVDGDLTIDLVAGVQDGRVVTSAELGPDPQQRDVGLLAHQEHRDLARHDDGLVALLA